MKFIACAFALATLSLLTACGDAGGEGGGEEGAGEEGEGEATTFSCLRDNVVCDSAAGEMCLHQRFGTGEGHTPECIDDNGCSDCDCAEAAAIAEFDGGSNCDGGVSCSIDDGAITIVCQNVGA